MNFSSRRIPPQPPHRHGARILVVDDESLVLRYTVQTLKGAGYEVIAASGPLAALDYLAREPGIDLLVTDVEMPGMSGQELARQVIARLGVPVVLMSGYSEDLVRRGGPLPGQGELLAKPFTTTQLLLRVRQALAAGPTAGQP